MKKQLLFLIALLLPMVASAAVEINGIFYNLNKADKSAEVTNNPNKYTGEVVIPSSVVYEGINYSVTSIGDNAFLYGSNLTSVSIPQSVTSIGLGAFSSCVGLTSITIPSSVTSIGEGALSNCENLKTVIFEDGKDILNFRYQILYANRKANMFAFSPIDSVYIGRIMNFSQVDQKGNKYYIPIFKENKTIRSIKIGENITRIEAESFSGCENLNNVDLADGLSTIGSSSFSGCSGLTSIVLPNGLTNIEYSAFKGCSELKSITLSNSVTSIGKEAFWGCESLFSISIPNNIKNIGGSAFSACGLESVQIEDGNDELLIEDNYWAPNFSGPIKSIYIGRNIRSSFSPFNTSIPFSLTIGNSVGTIPECLFVLEGVRKQFKITTLEIKDDDNTLIFEGKQHYPSPYSICMPFNNVSIDSVYCGRSLVGKNNGTANLFDGVISTFSLQFGDKIREINKNFMLEGSNISRLYIPDSVEKIDAYTFSNCRYLKRIYIEDGDNPLDFGGIIFSGSPIDTLYLGRDFIFPTNYSPFSNNKESLSTLIVGSNVTEIPEASFSGHVGLKQLMILEGVNKIRKLAFYGCNGLVSLTIPGSIDIIENQAFNMCQNLTTLNIEDGTNELLFTGEKEDTPLTTFFNSPLEEVYVGKNIKFTGPSSPLITISPVTLKPVLTKLIIGKNVNTIQDGTFGSTLSHIYCLPETAPKAGDISFTNAVLHVLKTSYKVYGSTQPWSLLNRMFAIYEDGQEKEVFKVTYIIDGNVYDTDRELEGNVISSMEVAPTKEGYNFSGWSEIPETMPAHDVTVTGTFNINKYKLTYIVDGEEYRSYELEYGTTITPETAPTKEGYTFSGWSEIPATMPAKNVTVTGSFMVNKYTLTYVVDGETHKTYEIEYGASITPEAEPSKDGYTFSGWSEIPAMMPAKDVAITGSFSKGEYQITYVVDGETYKTIRKDFGNSITAEDAPEKEGYTFSGWSEIPATMPANDVTVTGSFTINKYKMTYMLDGEEYKTYELEYGASITPEPAPTKESYIFDGWSIIPETMPAKDVTITGSFTYVDAIEDVYANDGEYHIYTMDGRPVDTLQKGVNIIRYKNGKVKKVLIK